MDQINPATLQAIVRVFRASRSILFVTGAGISADSGVPTYRGIGGLYDVEVTEEGLPIEEILSGAMLACNPALTWKYLAQIARAAHGASYNRAHEVIAEMERHFPRVWTVTQNVDGFHRQAGSKQVIEIHGNMHSLSCTNCARSVVVLDEDVDNLELPPRCPDCHAILRPDVVLFGEMLPENALLQLRREWEQGFDVVVAVGTSAVFPYIQEPFYLARQQGVPTIEINPDETVLSHHADYRLALGAAAALDEIWSRYHQRD